MKVVAKITDAAAAKRKGDADALREYADMVERGDVCAYVLVMDDVKENCFRRVATFNDRWRILGALEYAKLGFSE